MVTKLNPTIIGGVGRMLLGRFNETWSGCDRQILRTTRCYQEWQVGRSVPVKRQIQVVRSPFSDSRAAPSIELWVTSYSYYSS